MQYAITSLPPSRAASPERLLDLWRGRWEIENRLFWVRDVAFREDHSPSATARPRCPMSLIKNAAMNTLRILKVPNITAASAKTPSRSQPLPQTGHHNEMSHRGLLSGRYRKLPAPTR
ncbi:MAG: hypothetical protein R3B91_09160 [Planctomycetaceae bacterium]